MDIAWNGQQTGVDNAWNTSSRHATFLSSRRRGKSGYFRPVNLVQFIKLSLLTVYALCPSTDETTANRRDADADSWYLSLVFDLRCSLSTPLLHQQAEEQTKRQIHYNTYTKSRLVVLESGIGFESGLESIFPGLGLGLELKGLRLGLGLATYGLGLGLGLGSFFSKSFKSTLQSVPVEMVFSHGVLYYCTLQLAIQAL